MVQLSGSQTRDVLTGSGGDDQILGAEGDDVLRGDPAMARLFPDARSALAVASAGDRVAYVDERGFVVVVDLFTNAVTQVTAQSQGIYGYSDVQFSPSGDKLLFSSPTGRVADEREVRLYDFSTGSTTRLAAPADGGAPNGGSRAATFSGDGQTVLFSSNASNLVAGDANGQWDVFIRDLRTGTLSRINLTDGGAEATGGSSEALALSADGTKAAFMSSAGNLRPGDVANTDDLFVKDLRTGALTHVNASLSGGSADFDRGSVVFLDADRILFTSLSSDIAPGDGPSSRDIFIRTLSTGEVSRIAAGPRDDLRFGVAVSEDGDEIAFGRKSAEDFAAPLTTVVVRDLTTGVEREIDPADLTTLSEFRSLSADGRLLALRATNNPFSYDEYLLNLGPLDGNDRLEGGAGDDVLQGAGGNDALIGGEGFDLAVYTDSRVGVRVSLVSGPQDTVGAGVDTLVDIEGITGSAYDDELRGGAGRDTLDGGAGSDRLFGFDGDDQLSLTLGGLDRIEGGGGDDNIVVRPTRPSEMVGVTTVDGGAGSDTLTVSRSDDAAYHLNIYWNRAASSSEPGQALELNGIERLIVDLRPGDRFYAGDSASVFGSDIADRIDVSNATIYGQGGDDVLDGRDVYGGEGNDILSTRSWAFGGSGDDVIRIVGSPSNRSVNRVDGGDGVDELILVGSGAPGSVEGGSRLDLAQTMWPNPVIVGVEVITGTQAADEILGQDDGNRFNGLGGDDRLSGRGGDDALIGGAGGDLLDGGSGNDLLDGGEGLDTAGFGDASRGVVVDLSRTGPQDTFSGLDVLVSIENVTGTRFGDALTGSAAANVLNAGDGADIAWGGGGDDQVFMKDGVDQAFGEGGADYLEGGGGDDRLFGGQGNDWLEGDYQGSWFDNGPEGNDQLFGDEGNDVVRGNAGDDELYGVSGDDRLDGGAGDDRLDGGDGIDTISFDRVTVGAVVDLSRTGPQDTWSGRDVVLNVENVTGTVGGDALTGSAVANVLYAADGDDFVWGEGGDDQIFSKNGRDQAFAGDGADYVEGGGGDDVLFGGRGNDWVEGDYQGPWFDNGPSGNDRLFGDDGDDVIQGGLGADLLNGGGGADRFLFRSLSDSTAIETDRVEDFNGYVDQMDLSRIDADLNTAGDQAFRFVASFTGQAGQAVLSYDAGRNLSTLSLDANGDGQADFNLQMNGAHSTELGWVL